MWDPYAEFEKTVLPNGLTVYSSEWPDREWEAMGFVVHSGWGRDLPGFEGTAHFLEHLVSRNISIPRPNLENFFDENGGSVSFGRTSFLRTEYKFFLSFDAPFMLKALSFFGEMLFAAKLERFLEEQRRVIIGEFNRKYPMMLDFELDFRENRVLYPNHKLQLMEGPESINRIDWEQIHSYYREHYVPANVSVVAVGGLKTENLIQLILQTPLAVHKEGKRNPLPEPLLPEKLQENRYAIKYSDYTSLAMTSGRYRTTAAFPGNVSMVAIGVFKNMLHEILFNDLRERRGWIYDVDTSRENFSCFVEFSLGLKGIDVNATSEIEKTVDALISSIPEHKALFLKMKKLDIKARRISDDSGCGVRNGAVTDLGHYHRILTIKEEIDRLEAVSLDDISKITQLFTPEKRWTLLAVP